jgi:hypothetical protein
MNNKRKMKKKKRWCLVERSEVIEGMSLRQYWGSGPFFFFLPGYHEVNSSLSSHIPTMICYAATAKNNMTK